MATETKFGFLLVVVLIGALGFVMYKKWEKMKTVVATLRPAAQQGTVNPAAQDDAFANDPPAAQDKPFGGDAPPQTAQNEPNFFDDQPQQKPQQQPWPEQNTAQTAPAGDSPFGQQPAATAQAHPLNEDDFFPGEGQAPAQANTQADPFEGQTEPAEVAQSEPASGDDPFGQELAETPAQQTPPTQVAAQPEPIEEPPVTIVAKPAPTNMPPADLTEQKHPVAGNWESTQPAEQTFETPAPRVPRPINPGPLQQTGFESSIPDDADVTAHVVQPNENYWSISRAAYGTSKYYVALARYNQHRISDARTMRPGMKVLIPPVEVLTARYPDLFGGSNGNSEQATTGFQLDSKGLPVYRVGRRDTLTTIATQHLGRSSRWIQIFHMNKDKLATPNDLKIGTVLRLPADASRVALIEPATAIR